MKCTWLSVFRLFKPRTSVFICAIGRDLIAIVVFAGIEDDLVLLVVDGEELSVPPVLSERMVSWIKSDSNFEFFVVELLLLWVAFFTFRFAFVEALAVGAVTAAAAAAAAVEIECEVFLVILLRHRLAARKNF